MTAGKNEISSNKNTVDMRNRSKKHIALKSLINFRLMTSKDCFVSAVLKENNLTFPREHATTVLFSHTVPLNVYGSQTSKGNFNGMAMAGY